MAFLLSESAPQVFPLVRMGRSPSPSSCQCEERWDEDDEQMVKSTLSMMLRVQGALLELPFSSCLGLPWILILPHLGPSSSLGFYSTALFSHPENKNAAFKAACASPASTTCFPLKPKINF